MPKGKLLYLFGAADYTCLGGRTPYLRWPKPLTYDIETCTVLVCRIQVLKNWIMDGNSQHTETHEMGSWINIYFVFNFFIRRPIYIYVMKYGI